MEDEALAQLRRVQRGLHRDESFGDDLGWRGPPTNLTVMSYNLRASHIDKEVNTWWHHRREVLAGTVLKYQPAVIGTQEGLRDQLLDLLSLLPPSWRLFGCSRRGESEDDEHSALIYNTDEVEFRKGGDFWLSPTPDVPGSSAWGSCFPRMATWAKFKQLSTGHLFYIVNTHMDHVSEQARVEGAKVLLKTIEKLRRKNRAVIVTGDFNAAPGQGSYEVLRDGGFEDAWSKCNEMDTILHRTHTTFHHYMGTKLETWYCSMALYAGFRWHAGRFPHFGRYHVDWILYMNDQPRENSDEREIADRCRAEGKREKKSDDQGDTAAAAIVVDCDVEGKRRPEDAVEQPPATTVEPLCAMVCTDATAEGQYPSDHYALLAVFRLAYRPAKGLPEAYDAEEEDEVGERDDDDGDEAEVATIAEFR